MPERELSVKIRRATRDDLPALSALEQACFTTPWSEDSLRQDLETHAAARYLVAESSGGLILGYAACWVVLDEAQITNISADPGSRRHGIGRLLLQGLIDLSVAEGLERLVLEVRVSNAAARALYESCGFVPAGIRRAYYADNGEDAIIMLKNIGHNME